MESAFLSTGAKVIALKTTIRRKQQELAHPPPRRWAISPRCHGSQDVEKKVGRCGAIKDDEEWKEMGKWAGEKCRGDLGMVEMLECLEKEAIMGEDSGKDPTDYYRRACIFYKSSKVFEALRDEQDEGEQQQQQHPPA